MIPSKLKHFHRILLHSFLKIGKFVCSAEKKEEKPTFMSEPFDIDAFEGTTIELPCEGKGNPKPEVSLIQTNEIPYKNENGKYKWHFL